jgi:hypothetical protein
MIKFHFFMVHLFKLNSKLMGIGDWGLGIDGWSLV